MAGFARKMIVDAPSFVPARFGLLSVADMVTESDPHWANGVKTQPEAALVAKSYVDGCPTVAVRTKSIDEGIPTVGGNPFTVYGGFRCSPVGHSEDEIDRRASAALANGEARAVEKVLWTGASDNGETILPWLGNKTGTAVDFDVPSMVNVTPTPGTGVSARRALSLLEANLGLGYGGVPTIHVPRSSSSLLEQLGIVRTGSTLETLVGSKVACGGGYLASTTPQTLTAGTWFFGTGSVAVRRSSPRVVGDFASTLNKSTNDVLYLVERTYAVTWDTGLFGVLVDLTLGAV